MAKHGKTQELPIIEDELLDEGEQDVMEELPFDADVDDSTETTEVEKSKRTGPAYLIRQELQKKDLCHTLEEAAVRRSQLQLTDEEYTSGEWVKLSDIDKLCRQLGISISKFVRAFGGDRGFQPVAHPAFEVRYRGKVRYLPASAKTEGIEFLQTWGTAEKVEA